MAYSPALSPYRLGRKAKVTDSRTLALKDYLTLPAIPESRDWTNGVTSWEMLGNDTLGDCTCAAVGHAVQVWTLNASTEFPVTTAEVINIYEKWCGYSPNNPASDQGGIPLNVLKDWKTQGFVGHDITAFVSVDPSNLQEVRAAIDLFGGVYIGLELPIVSQTQTNTWYLVPGGGPNTEPGSWGGHCVFVPAYEPTQFKCITWGKNMNITNGFWNKYVDEAYAVLGVDWLVNGTAPNGLDLAALQADLTLL
jgi:hypothetical protein